MVSHSSAVTAPTQVLVADDEPALLDLVAKVLQRAGHRVTAVHNASEALAAFRAAREPIEVVVLDLTLAPSGALGLARQMLAERRVGLVLASGQPADPETRALLEEAGGCFLAKPFPPRELVAAVDQARAGAG